MGCPGERGTPDFHASDIGKPKTSLTKGNNSCDGATSMF